MVITFARIHELCFGCILEEGLNRRHLSDISKERYRWRPRRKVFGSAADKKAFEQDSCDEKTYEQAYWAHC